MFNIFADGQLIYQPGNDNLSLLSPKLTVEMGKAGSLEFSVPPTNRFYNTLYQIRTKLVVVMDGDEIFRGRVLTNKRTFNNVKEVYGEGDLSYLVDSCQKAKKYDGKAHALFRSIITEHNRMIQSSEKQFTVGQITVEDRSVVLKGQSDDIQDLETNKFDYKQIALNSISEEWQNTYDYIETTLLDYCGGYLRTRYDAASGKTYIDWLKDYYAESSQTIQFGKNLLDMTEEVSAEDLFTVLIPLGDENLTIEKVNNGSVELADANAVAKYGRIVKTNVFDGVTKPETLLENARRYLKNYVEVPTTYEIKAVDLHLINPSTRAIFVGDKVHVISPAHEIDNRDLVCTKIEYDLTNAANTTYTFGNPKQDLTERYRKNKKNDASRGGGGGGAATQKAKEESDEIWNAWVHVDAENATLDLNSLFRKINPDYRDDENADITNSKTRILLGSNDDGSKIDLFASFREKVNSMYNAINNKAGIIIKAGAGGNPKVTLYVEDNAKGIEGSIELGTLPPNYERKMYNADGTPVYVYDQDGNPVYERDEDGDIVLDTNGRPKQLQKREIVAENLSYTDIKTIELDIKSKIIDLQSDVTTIRGKVVNLETDYTKIDTKILDVIADKLKINATSGYISVPGIYTDHLMLDNYSIKLHRHKMAASASGKVQMGDIVWTDAESSFNIADTAFYKEHVSASLTGSFSKVDMNITVNGVNASGNTVLTKKIMNPYQPKAISLEIKAAGDHYEITPKPIDYAGNFFSTPTGGSFTMKTTNNAVYNNGKNSVTISSVNISKNYIGGTVYSVTATAQASNGKTKSSTLVL